MADPAESLGIRGSAQSMNEESVSENRESLATSQKDNKKNSPILEALSRHVSQWPDTCSCPCHYSTYSGSADINILQSSCIHCS